jgi:hypothetical protein
MKQQDSNNLNLQLWNLFIEGLSKVDPASLHVKDVISDLFPEIEKVQLPHVSIQDNDLICDRTKVSLEAMPLVLKLFDIFLHQKDWKIDRDTLMSKVYDLGDMALVSERRLSSCRHSAVKLVSRARRFAMKDFSQISGMNLSWFVYDSRFETWSLVKRIP